MRKLRMSGFFFNILVLSQCIPKVIYEKVTRLSTNFLGKLIFLKLYSV